MFAGTQKQQSPEILDSRGLVAGTNCRSLDRFTGNSSRGKNDRLERRRRKSQIPVTQRHQSFDSRGSVGNVLPVADPLQLRDLAIPRDSLHVQHLLKRTKPLKLPTRLGEKTGRFLPIRCR